MLDFAWSEFLVVIVVAVLAVGPKQLPEVLYGLGRIIRRLQYMKFALSRQFDDFMEQSDLDELKNLNNQARLVSPAFLSGNFEEEFDEASHDREYLAAIEPEPVTVPVADQLETAAVKTTKKQNPDQGDLPLV